MSKYCSLERLLVYDGHILICEEVQTVKVLSIVLKEEDLSWAF